MRPPVGHAATAPSRLVVSCEHGGNRIPPAYRHLFEGFTEVLESHLAYDLGSSIMAEKLAAAFDAPLFTATVSRLLVDLNRSIGHPQLHGAPVRHICARERRRIVDLYYQPHRMRVCSMVQSMSISRTPVVHIASHSFTPELAGRVRKADIGLLYDPSRKGEAALCAEWRAALRARAPALVVRRNYPYAGKNDGLTTWLRQRFAAEDYIGIELEINQKHVLKGGGHWADLREKVVSSLRDLRSWR